MEPDDVDDSPRNQWRLAKVTEVIHDDDGLVRKVKLLVGTPDLTPHGRRRSKLSVLERPIHKLVLLLHGQDYARPAMQSPTRSQPRTQPSR